MVRLPRPPFVDHPRLTCETRVPVVAAAAGHGERPAAGSATLALRPLATERVALSMHGVAAPDGGLLVRATPPTEPRTGFLRDRRHVPCDIVLVIDVSGSMGQAAPVPAGEGEAAGEDNGLSVLDLVKHAARTILETLDGGDRLGIVTFSTGARVLQPLTAMTPANKTGADARIAEMVPLDATNLWQGLMVGVGLFRQTAADADADADADAARRRRRVPALMLLTDGMPNFMSPPQGYVPKLRSLAPLPAPVHTFGFGYALRSGLLASLAEFSGGHYAFIPDAGLIGTVFVHAVANLQSTCATRARLRLTYPAAVGLEPTLGASVDSPVARAVEREAATRTPTATHAQMLRLTVPLGHVQYGQSRDVYLRCAAAGLVTAELEYGPVDDGDDAAVTVAASCHVSDDADDADDADDDLPAGEVAFHVSRSMVCRFLAGLAPLSATDEHEAAPFDERFGRELADLVAVLPAARPTHATHAKCRALLADVDGQVRLALTRADYYARWGRHYLPSLRGAHVAQLCNSFKDPGPLLYGAASPLFRACRDALDAAFDTLPPPPPSRPCRVGRGQRGVTRPTGAYARPVGQTAGAAAAADADVPISFPSMSMCRYRDAGAPCFASFCRVVLADGRRLPVHRLRRGVVVQTPRGPRVVAAVLKTPVRGAAVVPLGRLLITPWHPVAREGGGGRRDRDDRDDRGDTPGGTPPWRFPCRDAAARKQPPVRYTGAVYSLLLQPDADAAAHAVCVEGLWVVTLGHGLTDARAARAADCAADDVRVHRFFGDYAAVCRRLAALGVRKDGLVANAAGGAGFRRRITQK